jgi:polygalacturonase
LLEDVTFKYGAFWTINPSFCNNLIVKGITVLTNGEYGHTPNGDGINPNSCQNVLIEYNTLDTGDDCITLKSGRNRDGRRIGIPCKNILIRHNVGLQGHGGIVIGSEMSGGVENVYAHDCKFNGTDRVIRIKTDRGRGGYVRNCWFKDISADTIQREAIRINMLYTGGDRLPEQEVNEGTPFVENIHYENIQCDFSKRNVIQIIGLPEMPVRNISFKNITFSGNTGIEIIDAKNITLENLKVSNKKGSFASISYCDSITIDSLNIVGTDTKNIPIVLNSTQHIQIDNITHQVEGVLINVSGNSDQIEIDKSIPENQIVYGNK